ncbi:uncharacterized protein LOC135936519 isoform X1 [Cloeon dipterum]|uniref:uncharacterized protein LOC135936519 isoform X1 n=1 Tax=Cloeon dipterum TaxID=197152 RepID=UPI00321F77A8
MEENQSLREEAQVQERKVELLKKARRDFKNQNLDSVRSLQKAVVEPGTRRYAAAVYLDSKDNIEQQISKDGWRAVLLNDPDLPQKMKSGARSSDNLIAIADGELNECYEESKGSFISCLRHVAISIFRVERLLYFSYGGTKRTGRREATLSLPQPLKEAFFDIATQIARMERYTWFERSKGASSSVSDVKRSAKRALADLITERRPKSKTDKDGRSSTESIDSEDD